MESIIIILLVIGSITGLTFIVERGLALRASKVVPVEIEKALERCRSEGDLPMLRHVCEQHPSTLGRLVVFADSHRGWPKAENVSALETRAHHEISKLERGLVVLEIIVGVAPLMGLVGTIFGLIILFNAIDAANNSGEMARGIATALYATLLGLLTAIPSLIAWSYYNKKIETYAVEMAALCEDFIRRQYQDKSDAAVEPLNPQVH